MKTRGLRRAWKTYRVGTLFALPFILLYLVFVILPIFMAGGLSLTDYNLLETPRFVGLNNYKLLFMQDEVFLKAVSNTLVFAVISGPVGLLMSFVMAWIINKAPLSKLLALAFYAPSLTSGIAMSTVWMYFFSSDRYGLFNNILFNLGIINEPILWNMDERTILPVIIVVSIWMSMGTGFMVFLAGLKNTSQEIAEAGRIDGIHTGLQELFYITLPQMKPQLLFGAVNAVVAAFGSFEIAMGVAGFPSPNYAGHTMVAHLYDYAFVRFQMGYASAIAMVLFLFTFVIGKICTRLLTEKD